jgi:hypothetical protein
VRNLRTNTPLQALTLMNDMTYVESARVLAEMLLLTKKQSFCEEVFGSVLQRKPTLREIGSLKQRHAEARSWYEKNPMEAERFVRHGQSLLSGKIPNVELAAGAVIVSIVMNSDEAITRE